MNNGGVPAPFVLMETNLGEGISFVIAFLGERSALGVGFVVPGYNWSIRRTDMRLMGLALAGMVGVAASFASVASANPSSTARTLTAPMSAVENVQYGGCRYGERRVCVRRDSYGECRRWVCRSRDYY